jgi:hypothetical protein
MGFLLPAIFAIVGVYFGLPLSLPLIQKIEKGLQLCEL